MNKIIHSSITTKFIAIVLIVGTIISSYLPVLADSNLPSSINFIIKELENYRTEYSKTYERNDGKIETVVSTTPLHYKTLGGFKEYDNTLVLKDGCYQNKDAPINIKLPENLDGNKEVSVTNEDFSISLKLIGAKNTKAKKQNKAKSNTAREQQTAQEVLSENVTLTDSAVYENVLDNTNIAYDVNVNSLKESIILQQAPKKQVSYKYQIKAKNLKAVLNKNGSVCFYDKQNKEDLIFFIPAPFMFDNRGEYSGEVETKLEVKNNKTTLTYIPNYEWLTDLTREYPVTVDPTIKVTSGLQDAYTYSYLTKQDEILGFEDQLKVGKSAWLSACDYFETYIQFPTLPALHEDAVITDANITLTGKQVCGSFEELDIGVYNVLEEWINTSATEGNYLTYTNKPNCAEEAISTTTVNKDCVANQVNFNVNSLINGWYNNPESNHGVKLSLQSITNNNWDSVIFHSKQSVYSPFLSIAYVLPEDANEIIITNRPENDRFVFLEATPYLQLDCEVYPTDIYDNSVLWEVSDNTVATIDEEGKLTALKSGSVTVTATLECDENITDSFTLTLQKSLIKSFEAYCVHKPYIGGQAQITTDIDTNLTNDIKLRYTTSNSKVATVDSNGMVTAKSKGSVTITVNAIDFPEAKSEVTFDIASVIESIPNDNTISTGTAWQLTDVQDAVITYVEGGIFTTEGQDPGFIKANYAGSAEVIVYLKYYDYYTAYESITLHAVGDLTFECFPQNKELTTGDTLDLSIPDFSFEQTAWYSDDSSILECIRNESGWYLYAKKPGRVRIVGAVTTSSAITATGFVYITVVKRPIQNVTIHANGENGREYFYPGETFPCHIEIDPYNAYYEKISWSYSKKLLSPVYDDSLDISKLTHIGFKAKEVTTQKTATISAKIEGVTYTKSITLKPITIEVGNAPQGEMQVGDTRQLYYNITGPEGLAEFVSWQTTNEDIVSVSSNGLITAQSPGTAKIRAVAKNTKTNKYYYSEDIIVGTYQPAESISITNQPTNNTLIIGETCNLNAAFTPSNATYTNVTWSSSNPSVASINSSGVVTAHKAGKTSISLKSVTYGFEKKVTITVLPTAFGNLINKNAMSKNDYKCTNDGFYISTKPLSKMLISKDIDDLIDKNSNEFPCDKYYDDWYLYAIDSAGVYTYSFIKLREQENDYELTKEGDDPCVTISFVEFNISTLIETINNPTSSNKRALYTDINIAVANLDVEHNQRLEEYFVNPASKASYLVADLYIKHLAKCVKNGYIEAPENYINIINEGEELDELLNSNDITDPQSYIIIYNNWVRTQRVPNALKALNTSSHTIYNTNTHRLYIEDPNNLTANEEYALLMMFTGNVNRNSFAAEVKFHAEALSWAPDVTVEGINPYHSAIRADMGIGEGSDVDGTTPYYDLNSDIVKEQGEFHGEQ